MKHSFKNIIRSSLIVLVLLGLSPPYPAQQCYQGECSIWPFASRDLFQIWLKLDSLLLETRACCNSSSGPDTTTLVTSYVTGTVEGIIHGSLPSQFPADLRMLPNAPIEITALTKSISIQFDVGAGRFWTNTGGPPSPCIPCAAGPLCPTFPICSPVYSLNSPAYGRVTLFLINASSGAIVDSTSDSLSVTASYPSPPTIASNVSCNTVFHYTFGLVATSTVATTSNAGINAQPSNPNPVPFSFSRRTRNWNLLHDPVGRYQICILINNATSTEISSFGPGGNFTIVKNEKLH